jgi:methylmalonyl-CoA mutase
MIGKVPAMPPEDAKFTLNEFPPASRDDWAKLVERTLKGAPFEKLVSTTYDGLRIEPLYARKPDASPVAGRATAPAWRIMQRIDHPDPAAANAQALDDLENGTTGVTLVCAGSINANGYGIDGSAATLNRVLDGVQLDAGITIDFNLGPETRGIVCHFAALVKSRRILPASVDLRASINPIGGMAAAGGTDKPWSDLAPAFAALVSELAEAGFRGSFAVADGRIVHNAGGSEAQELAFALASAIAYLRALAASGIALEAARSMIYFRLSADADQFLTIAKFRAVRKLWARVEQACGLTPKPAYVSAETAWRMMTKRDPWVNMLRTTTATFAAGVGGADAVTVLPFTAALGLPDAFARRVARNTQLVLLEESNLAKVLDPAAGSGGVEALTDNLCHAAWTLFQEVEAAGGATAALEGGLIQQRVAETRRQREAAAARRTDLITGTSEFPHLQELPVAVLDVVRPPKPAVMPLTIQFEPLPPLRLAMPYEKLRDASDRILAQTGFRPKIFLANLGTPADFTARAAFAKNFFEVGGIGAVAPDDVMPETVTPSSPTNSRGVGAIISAFLASGARLACLCSSDEVYAKEGAAAAKALRKAGVKHVYLAGRGGEQQQSLRAAGVQTFVYSGCDALATLQAAHDILGIEAETANR